MSKKRSKRASPPLQSSSPITLGALLIKGSAWFWAGLTANLKVRGMTSTTRSQGYVIAHISAGEHRASRIAKKLGISPQATSRLLSEMESQGIISIREEPGDRRARIVEFNPAWKEYHEFTRKIMHELEDHLADELSKPLVDVLRYVLESDWGDPPLIDMEDHKMTKPWLKRTK